VILQSLEELENDLRDRWRSVYLILGAEQYQCRSAIALLKSKAMPADAVVFDYSEFTVGDASVDEILEAANTFPMASKRRLVLVTKVEKLKDFEQESLLEALSQLSVRSVLLLHAEELDHRKRFYKNLQDKYCVAEFSKLKGVALERWADAFLRRQGYQAPNSSIKRILELAGSDLQTLASELEKLMLYAGEQKTISANAIEELVRTSRQHGIFELIGAIGQRDRNAALKSLASLLSMGEHPLVIVAMMARHCRQIMIAKEGLDHGTNAREIGSMAQIPPFLLDQFLRQARAADNASVQTMYLRLASIDKKLKSSSLDGRMLLESLICALV
jgi:DNA polymerase-3 subunit delta